MVAVSVCTVLLASLVPDFQTFLLSVVPLIGVTVLPLGLAVIGDFRDYDSIVAFSLFAGTLVFIYQFFNQPEVYVWNILPVAVTVLMFLLTYLVWGRKVKL